MGQGLILVEHRQEHHSRTNVDHLEQLFVSTTLRNQLKFSKGINRSRFALIYECDLYTRPFQTLLKYLKTHHLLYSLGLRIDIYIMCH